MRRWFCCRKWLSSVAPSPTPSTPNSRKPGNKSPIALKIRAAADTAPRGSSRNDISGPTRVAPEVDRGEGRAPPFRSSCGSPSTERAKAHDRPRLARTPVPKQQGEVIETDAAVVVQIGGAGLGFVAETHLPEDGEEERQVYFIDHVVAVEVTG